MDKILKCDDIRTADEDARLKAKDKRNLISIVISFFAAILGIIGIFLLAGIFSPSNDIIVIIAIINEMMFAMIFCTFRIIQRIKSEYLSINKSKHLYHALISFIISVVVCFTVVVPSSSSGGFWGIGILLAGFFTVSICFLAIRNALIEKAEVLKEKKYENSQVEKLEKMLGINLPTEKDVLFNYKDFSFAGRASQYIVLKLNKEPTEFLSSTYSYGGEPYKKVNGVQLYKPVFSGTLSFKQEQNTAFEQEFEKQLTAFSKQDENTLSTIPKEYYPNWKDKYLHAQFDGIQIVYLPNKLELLINISGKKE